jgi:hypothetical protein
MDAIADSGAAAGPPLRLSRAIWTEALGFCIASLIVFATVAFGERWMYQNLGVYGSYAVWALLFVVLGGAALSPLRDKRKSLLSFYLLFGISFLLYAVGWTAVYFMLGGGAVLGGGLAEWAASLAGSALMGMVFALGLGNLAASPTLIAILFVANSAGYFLGGVVFYKMHSRLGMVAWGGIFGLFLGAGLGWAICLARPSRQVLRGRVTGG